MRNLRRRPTALTAEPWVTLRCDDECIWSSCRSDVRKNCVCCYRGFGRFILAATIAGWWVTWDLGGRSALPAALVRKSLGTFESSTAETILFWVPPIVSLGIFLILCYIVDRKLLRQRWSFTQLLWRAWWRLVSFVIPLL